MLPFTQLGQAFSRTLQVYCEIFATMTADPEAAVQAAEFLRRSDQFRLGDLVTESPHPLTRDLSAIAGEDLPEAISRLLDVDADVIATYRRWAEGPQPVAIARTMATALRAGGRLFFTGCGATGRLSIQLAAIWRDHWQRHGAPAGSEPSARWQDRAVSVMAGGDFALIKSVEGFEDYARFGRRQIKDHGVGPGDVVFAITEGGETSFVIGTAWQALEAGATVFFVYNNPDEVLERTVERSREVLLEPRIQKINLTTGPMAITGSTRMQATSIQLAVMTTLLEMVLCELEPDGATVAPEQPASGEAHAAGPAPHPRSAAEIPAAFLRELVAIHANLRTRALRDDLARWIKHAESGLRHGRRNNDFADHLAIDVLTDTTERSPTFSVPAFRKSGDTEAVDSTSFLYLPESDTGAAWRRLLKRDLQPVPWSPEVIGTLVDPREAARVSRIVAGIGRGEILRFRIGLEGLADRPFRPGDSATALLTDEELSQLTGEHGFYRVQLQRAAAAGARLVIILAARPDALSKAQVFLAGHALPEPVVTLMLPLPETPSPLRLRGPMRVGVKMLLNIFSTLTMVRQRRVLGNTMICVVPGNMKLIDRCIRYVRHLTGLDYAAACQRVHEAIEHVKPRMRAGREFPPVVALCVIAQRHSCSLREAEQRMDGELGLGPG